MKKTEGSRKPNAGEGRKKMKKAEEKEMKSKVSLLAKMRGAQSIPLEVNCSEREGVDEAMCW